jgi:hypothetical protein
MGEVVVPRIHTGEHHRGERPLERACKQEALVGTVGKGASGSGVLHKHTEAPAMLPLEGRDGVTAIGVGGNDPSGNDRAEAGGNNASTGRQCIHLRSFLSASGGMVLLNTEHDRKRRSAGLYDDAAKASFVHTAFDAIDNEIMAEVIQACSRVTGTISAENGRIEKFEKFTLGRRCASDTAGTDGSEASGIRSCVATKDRTMLEHGLA